MRAATAGFAVRLWSAAVDLIFLSLLGLGLAILTSTEVLNIVVWPATAAYYCLCEGGAIGQTVGKRVAGIRVVDDLHGGPLGYWRAFERYVVSWVSLLCLTLGYLSMVGDSAGQTWHDRAARSLVVRVRAD